MLRCRHIGCRKNEYYIQTLHEWLQFSLVGRKLIAKAGKVGRRIYFSCFSKNNRKWCSSLGSLAIDANHPGFFKPLDRKSVSSVDPKIGSFTPPSRIRRWKHQPTLQPPKIYIKTRASANRTVKLFRFFPIINSRYEFEDDFS